MEELTLTTKWDKTFAHFRTRNMAKKLKITENEKQP